MRSETVIETLKGRLRLCRSFLLAPASRPECYEGVHKSDSIILDLESTVSLEEKEKARKTALDWLKKPKEKGLVRIIRINSLRTTLGLKDILALHEAGLAEPAFKPDAIILPRCEAADELGVLADLLDGPLASIGLIPMIELARALFVADRIANAHERVSAVFLGGGDLAHDLHADGSWESLLCARSCVVAAAATRGIASIDVPYFKKDEAGLATEAAGSRKLGMTAKAALHKEQIETLNSVFMKS